MLTRAKCRWCGRCPALRAVLARGRSDHRWRRPPVSWDGAASLLVRVSVESFGRGGVALVASKGWPLRLRRRSDRDVVLIIIQFMKVAAWPPELVGKCAMRLSMVVGMC